MTNKEFVDTIYNYYIKSRELTIDPSGFNIWRGVSHSISSKSEDLFALFVAEKLNDDKLEFIVDKTMTINIIGRKSIQFRPDLAIVNGNLLTHIIDLKMDMGYKRRYFETDSFQKEEEKFQILRDQSFERVTFKIGKSESRQLRVSRNIVNQIVVVSEKNEGAELNRKEMIKAIQPLDWVNIYYLTGKFHPNNYEGNKPVLKEPEFERFFRDVKMNLS